MKEYFQSHEMSYPLDTAGVVAGSCDLVNIKKEELSTDDALEYVEEGMMSVKIYFQNKDVRSLMPGVDAITVNKPVLYRDDSGKAGLMVKVTGYGAGKPDSRIALPIEYLGSKNQIWKVENFAYFNFSNDYKWQYGGWVY